MSFATYSIAVDICWDTLVEHFVDSVHRLSVLAENVSYNWHGARYHGRHGERRLCSHQMAGCLCPVSVLFGASSWSIYESRIVCLWQGDNFDVLAKQHLTLIWKVVIFEFPVLQGSAEYCRLINKAMWEIVPYFNFLVSEKQSRQKVLKSNDEYSGYK